MLENKKLNMVLSLMIAIALWAFVIGEVNPEATRTYREIPIQLINEEVLDESGLAVLSVSDTVMGVTITGTRSEVNQIDTKDITAVVDLEEAELGENQIRVEVKVPNKVDVDTQSLSKVTVIVEEKIAREVEIRVRYNGEFEAEKEPVTIDQSAYSVTVMGAASNVERVSHVNAVAKEGSVRKELSTFSCGLVPVNSGELRVYNVDLSLSSIEVTAELAKTKTVPLIVPVKETKKDNIVRTITVPEEITLKGRGTDLEDIEEVTAEEIDVSQIMENKTIEIVPILPDNIQISSETESLLLQVKVTHMKSKEITFDEGKVEFTRLGEGLSAKLKAKKIRVILVGSTDIVNNINEENIRLSADLTGLDAGKHTVKLKAECSVPSIEINVSPESVTVNVEKDSEAVSEEDNGEKTENEDSDTKQNETDENIEE